MVGPNCRVHITADDRRGGQGVNLALLQSPLERCISESQMPQPCKAPESARGDPLPGHDALERKNIITVAEHCFREDLLVTPLPPWRKTSGLEEDQRDKGMQSSFPAMSPAGR